MKKFLLAFVAFCGLAFIPPAMATDCYVHQQNVQAYNYAAPALAIEVLTPHYQQYQVAVQPVLEVQKIERVVVPQSVNYYAAPQRIQQVERVRVIQQVQPVRHVRQQVVVKQQVVQQKVVVQKIQKVQKVQQNRVRNQRIVEKTIIKNR